MEKDDIFHDCISGTPPESQDMAQEKRGTSVVTEEDVARDVAINPFQTKLEVAYENLAGFPLRAGAEDYDGDIDSDRNSSINRSGDAESDKYRKQAKLWSLVEKSQGSNALPRVSDGVCWNDEVPQGQESTSDSARDEKSEPKPWQLTEGPEEHKSEPGSLRVRIPSPYAGHSANPNPSHLQYHSPRLLPRGGEGRPNPYYSSISLISSSSSSFVNLNEHAYIEGPNRKALEKLTDGQVVAVADKNIDEAKRFLIEVNSTNDERSNALTLMTDWNDVKVNAQQRQIRSLTADGGLGKPRKVALPEHDGTLQKQEDPGTSKISKGRRRLRKRLSGFFKKTPAPSDANVTSKGALSIELPIIKAKDTPNTAELHPFIDMVNATDVNAEASPDECTSTLPVSWSESTSDYDEAMESDAHAPPIPMMSTRLAEPESPDVKRRYRNVHVIGSSPDHTVIIDNTNAYFSPDKRHHRQPAKITDAASASSGHEHCATTPDVVGRCSVVPFDADFISEHAKNSGTDNDDTPSTPSRKHRPKASKVAAKRPNPRSILNKGERCAEVHENDIVTPTQQSFDALAYSGDEDSVHTANVVRMTFSKATMVDIPAKRGNKYPATIDQKNAQNEALFSNPPDENIIRVEIEVEAKAALKARVAADEAMAKRQENAPAELKTNRALLNLKIACRLKEEKGDDCKEEVGSEHNKEDGDKHDKGDRREGTEIKDKDGSGGHEGNGTARARMERY